MSLNNGEIMREGVLFELTKDHLESGFQGVPAGYCITSHVDPKKGLSYAGRPISGLISRRPEEIIYLLMFGEMGTKDQVAGFYGDLSARAVCKGELVRQIYALPKADRPMDVLATAILIAGMYESRNDYREDCLNIIAKIPHIAACVMNSQAGFGETPDPNPDLGYIENFAAMLSMEKGDLFTQTLRLFSILNFDLGGGNLSAFVGKAVSSSLENMYGCLASAMTSLGGARVGGALQDAFSFVSEISKAEETREALEARFQKGQVPGFGSTILKIEDPRAHICYEYCQKYFPENPLVRTAWVLREESTKIPHLFPNVDAISGVMLRCAGFKDLEYAPILLGAARSIGIAIQVVYERLLALEGKGTPIMRPSYIYKHRL